MLNKYPEIELYKGASKLVSFDLSDTDMSEGCFVMTMSDSRGNVLMTVTFDEPRVYNVLFEDEFTRTLKTNERYYYDIMYHIIDERFPQCSKSLIVVRETVGGMKNE